MKFNTIQDIIETFPKHKEKLALKYRSQFRKFNWSYNSLYKDIRKFSVFLDKQGIKKGDKVLLWGFNSPQWVIVHLGTLYHGSISVPADSMATPQAVNKIIKISKPDIIIKTKLRPCLETKKKVFFIEEIDYVIENYKISKSKPKIDSTDIAEIVYTSGTTGNPKGVVLTHKNISTNINQINNRIVCFKSDKILSLLPLSHMLEQTGGLFTPLSKGASIIYINSLTSKQIVNALGEEDINVIIIVPRILQSLKQAIQMKINNGPKIKKKIFNLLFEKSRNWDFEKRKKKFKSIHKKLGINFKFFVSGGAPLDKETLIFWERLGFPILQGYGLSECSPVLSCENLKDKKFGSVGKAFQGVEVKTNKEGEILAKGDNIFKGYYKNPTKTKGTFSNNWFLTGDIGEIDNEGYLFIKSRKKDLIVTSSGMNVYPEDIEPLLNKHKGVYDSCVIGYEEKDGESVHAVLILEKGFKNPEKIIEKVNEKLDSTQKILGYTIWSEPEFPKTTTMKLKKNIIKEKIMSLKNGGKLKEVSEEISKLNFILSQVCKKEANKIKEDFNLYSDLGIDSLGKVELVSLIEKEFFYEVDENLITEKTTVKDLEDIINNKKVSKASYVYPKWPQKKIFRNVTKYWFEFIDLGLSRLFIKLKTEGEENLKDIKEPVLFVSNHISFLDYHCVLRSLPKKFRHNTYVSGLGEYYYPIKKVFPYWIIKKIFYYYSITTMRIFMMFEESNFRKSLQESGRLYDLNYNLLIFPEGERTLNKNMLPLKSGIVTLIKSLRIKVIPIGLSDDLLEIWPRGRLFIKPGKVKVKIGKPIIFKNESSKEILLKIKNEIEKLRK